MFTESVRDDHRATRTIGTVLFPDVEGLDAVGPWEVLAAWTLTHPRDGWAVTTLSVAGDALVCANGLVLTAPHLAGVRDRAAAATVTTSVPVRAGIDTALHLVDRPAGTRRAREVRRYVQDDLPPPI